MTQFFPWFFNKINFLITVIDTYPILGNYTLLDFFLGAFAITVVVNVFWKGAKA